MAQKVKMPDGVVVSFPDDMPREEIKALIEAKFPEQVKKSASPTAAEPEWRRGSLAPVERNEQTGELRPAVPGVILSAVDALMAPGKAARGEYGVEVNSETGAVSPFPAEMMDDASALAGLVGGGAPQAAGAALRTGTAGSNALGGLATRNLKRALRYDGIDPADVPARLRELGPDAVPGDLGPALQAQTQAVGALPGPGQKTVVDALTARKEGRNRRIIDEVDETFGPAPVPARLAEENLANRRALSPEYETLWGDASSVDTSQIAINLNREIAERRGPAQGALQRVRDMLNVAGSRDHLDPNPRTLFEVRNAIDGMLEEEANSKVIGALSDIRQQIDMELAAKVPRIKQVDAKFEELARQSEAVDTGQTLLDSGRTAIRPETLEDTFAPSAVPERGVGPSAVPFRLQQGNRAEIERIIGTTANDLNALKTALKGDGSWNRERLTTLYGQEKADALMKLLDRESTYSATEGPALGGARTAVLNAANEELVGPTKKPGFFQNALNFNGGSALAALGDTTLGWIDRGKRTSAGAQMANYLTARPGSNMLESLPSGTGPSAVTRAAPSLTLREIMERGGPKTGEALRIEM